MIPSNLARLADEANKRAFEDQKRRLAKKIDAQKNDAVALKNKIDGLTLELTKKIGGSGKLFGTVTNTELAKELAGKGIEIERRIIHIDTPIKTLGQFDIKVKLFTDVEACFKVKVSIDEKQALELKAKQEAAAKKKKEKAAAPVEENTATEGAENSEESEE